MNITAGIGKAAWKPGRLSVEAHAGLPLTGTPDELLTASVVAATFGLGSLGTLRTGELIVHDLPAGWRASPWPRVVRPKLVSEHGVGYLAVGLASSTPRERGRLSQVPLSGIEDLYLDGPGTGAAIDGGALTPGGVVSFGGVMPEAGGAGTRRAAIDAALEPYPEAEAGVSADLKGVVGRPGSATPAQYTIDGRATGLRPLGYAVTAYVTDAAYQAGPEYPVHVYSRQDVPAFIPRRSEAITFDPMTETVDEQAATATEGTLGVPFPVEGSFSTRTWKATFPPNYATIIGGQRPVDVSVLRALKFRLDYTVEKKTGEPVNLTLRLFRANGSSFSLAAPPLTSSGVFQQDFELPADLWGPDAQSGFGHVTKILIDVSGDVPDGSTPTSRNTFALNAAAVIATREYERHWSFPGKPMPRGYSMPYFVGPTFEFTLPGVHVPPYLIHGLPGGLSQYAAGVEITLNQEGRRGWWTKFLTGALPYPGQQRAP